MPRFATAAMGTRFEIVIAAGPAGASEAALTAAGEAAIEEIEGWHRRLSRFAPDSLVSHINRTAASSAVALDAATWRLVEDAEGVRIASGGAFDVTAGSAGAAGRALVLDENARTIRFAGAGVALDLGAIGKGHALDAAADVLREAGVTSAFLHGGTSSGVAIGLPPGEAGWRVALGSSPDADVISLVDAAFSVSDAAARPGPHGRGHIVDPRAAPRSRHAATDERPRRAFVVGPSARLADAWSTAIVVLGRVPALLPPGYAARFLPADPVAQAGSEARRASRTVSSASA